MPASILQLIPVLILIALASATLGLLVGTIVKPMQIAAMFPGLPMPVVSILLMGAFGFRRFHRMTIGQSRK